MSATAESPSLPARTLPPVPAVVAALAIVYVVWGSTYLGIRIVVEESPPLTSMGQRYFVSGLILAAVLALRSGLSRLAVTWRQLVGCGVLGLLLPLLGNGMVAVAESKGATSGYTALLIAVTPLAIVVFRTLAHDRPSPRTLAGVLTGFVGLAVLVGVGRDSSGIPLGAALLIVFAATCWGFGSWVQPRLWLPQDPFVVATWEMVLGGLWLTGAGLVAGETFTLDHTERGWWALGYLVVFGSVIAFSAYVWLVSRVPISLVATYAYVNPVIAVVLGWLVLGEQLTLSTALGGAIVVGAVALVISSER